MEIYYHIKVNLFVFPNLKQDENDLEDHVNDRPIRRQESKEEPYDYSQDWSDYDWWGYDGVVKKRKENQRRTLGSTSLSGQKNIVYEKRQRRRLGSM